jgi:hypothetical protein
MTLGVVFTLLVLGNIFILRDALINGPVWFSNYGLAGLQYGASQLFPAVIDYHESHPDSHIIVSPNWANGTDVLARFFSTDEIQFELGSIEGYLVERKPLGENTVFVMIPDEYNEAVNSGKFKDIKIDQTLPYPNIQPGFYFVRLLYVDNIDEIMQEDVEARHQLQEAEVTIDGQSATVLYSPLDMGTIELLFDGDRNSVARTLEANPFVLDITFDQARNLSGLSAIVGSIDILIDVQLFTDGQTSVEFTKEQRTSVDSPQVDINFDKAYEVKHLRLEISYPYRGEPEHVHVWELLFK